MSANFAPVEDPNTDPAVAGQLDEQRPPRQITKDPPKRSLDGALA
jgi:hypothetical protein